MATPKFDLISMEFARRINDPVASASTDGNILEAALRTAYVNKALNNFFADMLKLAGGKNQLQKIMPELVAKRQVTVTYSASPELVTKYTIANPNLDVFDVYGAFMGLSITPTLIRVWDRGLFDVAMSNDNPDYETSITNPALIFLGNEVYFFPRNFADLTTDDANVFLLVLKKPVDPTTGGALTQNGSYDSPFSAHWTSDIAEVAEQLYNEDAQNNA